MTDQEAFDSLSATLLSGDIAVVRTDTLYGVVALARNQVAVEKVFDAKGRNASKQCIVLLSSADDAPAHTETLRAIDSASMNPVTIIVPVHNEPEWLLRGGDSLAYRIVRNDFLQRIIQKVGPIIAPSANPEGQPPARTVQQAYDYFGSKVDAYIDGGEVPENARASTIIKLHPDGSVTTIRP